MNDTLIDDNVLSDYRLELIARFGQATFHSWMSDIDLVKGDDTQVEVSTGSLFRRETLVQRFKPGMHEAWNGRFGRTSKFVISVRPSAPGAGRRDNGAVMESNRASQQQNSAGQQNSRAGQQYSAAAFKARSSGDKKTVVRLDDIACPINQRSTFETFAVDETNRIAAIAAKKALDESRRHNLIYLYGPSGVGKTHLLHAVGNEWRALHGDGASAYLTHSSLTDGCVEAALSNSLPGLQRDFQTKSLLLIDDIHLIAGKKRTEQEVLTLINAGLATGRVLVIAGEAAPSVLAQGALNGKLADRLSGDLPAPIERGGAALRRAVLSKRASQSDARCLIEPSAIDFIADAFPQSMREAIGAFNQLVLVYGDEDMSVGLEEANAALSARIGDRKPRGTMDDGITAAAAAFNISVDDVKGRAQPQHIVKARHAFVYVARESLKESFPRIAAKLGRDHTTAMNSYNRATALLERQDDFRKAVEEIRRAVGG